MASCPSGYYAQGNRTDPGFCNGEWCSPINPFSPRQFVKHVWIHCVRPDGASTDVYAYSEIECSC